MPRDFNHAQLKLIEKALAIQYIHGYLEWLDKQEYYPESEPAPIKDTWSKIAGLLALVRMYIESYDHTVD